MSEAFPSTNGIAAPSPCSAGTLFSGKKPTIMTPSPRSPAVAFWSQLNSVRGDLVGDGAGVAGHGGRVGVDLVEEQFQGAGAGRGARAGRSRGGGRAGGGGGVWAAGRGGECGRGGGRRARPPPRPPRRDHRH